MNCTQNAQRDNLFIDNSINISNSIDQNDTTLKIFTHKNKNDVEKCWSIFFRSNSFRTNETNFRIIHTNLIHEIINIIDTNRFILIYGNSGRGKSFFVFDFIKEILKIFDIVMYYSPQFNTGSSEDFNLIFNKCNRFLIDNKKLLFIIDESHLANDNFKKEMLYMMNNHDNLCILMISRDRQEDIIPSKYLENKLFKNFNKVAENTFKKIVEKFCHNHKEYIEISSTVEESLKNEIEGSNLIFLTLILQSWESLITRKKKVSIDEIKKYTYSRFLEYYDKNLSNDWKYINNLVSAFFQYEIRIDKDYLSQDNPNLAKYDIETGQS